MHLEYPGTNIKKQSQIKTFYIDLKQIEPLWKDLLDNITIARIDKGKRRKFT